MNRVGFTGIGHGWRLQFLNVIAATWLVGVLVGCASPGTNLVDCPLSIEQQQLAVLEVVPRGSSRADAERRLKEAGIEFSAGQGNSIYYLSLWNRQDGKRWHINVALLFDSQGRLYQTRPADTATQPLSADVGAGHGAQAYDVNGGASAGTGSAVLNDDELKNVPFPDQIESRKAAR